MAAAVFVPPGTFPKKPLREIPLYQAMNVSKHKEIDRMLVQGVDLRLIDDHGENYFHHLVKPGSLPYSYRVDYLRRALPFIDPSSLPIAINYRNHDGLTPVHLMILSAKNKNKNLSDLIDGFVQLGADVNRPTGGKDALTPLMLAAQSPIGAFIATLLLNHGANVMQTDGNGRTALHHAILSKNLRYLNVLLQDPVWVTPVAPGNRDLRWFDLKNTGRQSAMNYLEKLPASDPAKPHLTAAIQKAIQGWKKAEASANVSANVSANKFALEPGEEKQPDSSVAAASSNQTNTAAVLRQMMGQGYKRSNKRSNKHRSRSSRRHLKRKLRRTIRVPR